MGKRLETVSGFGDFFEELKIMSFFFKGFVVVVVCMSILKYVHKFFDIPSSEMWSPCHFHLNLGRLEDVAINGRCQKYHCVCI